MGLLFAAPALAHAPDADAPPDLAHAWSADLWLTPLWAASLLLYLLGLRQLWRHGFGRGVGRGQALSFFCGWLALGLAMVWPLDALGAWSLAAHMAQHMVLMALAPPLLLAGLPGAVWLAALPSSGARAISAPLRGPAGRRTWRVLTGATLVTLLQAAVMWGWHLPAAMELALRNELVHYAMHLCFLVAGLLFWAALLRSLREPSLGAGSAVTAIIATMLHMGLLSALLVFASRPLYPWYFERVPQLGLSALEDQQLAGLIMWVPSALPYLVGGVALVAAWLARNERHTPGPRGQQG
ncbi:cytochrome c oxidase assembly protein [Alkalisalibacterium limincola]|uniref:Cytochrome c oxidase assembly protein n=1 Tax=Alkalisalibacterium limincola TaxID=2699169 RepID=A0A5C8KQ08_9GAMM|nr:cytochrome c oxidase assembly protein [Alkalisalibacterium limincola]TXK62327.1 cytochrome c oxidase assembly protein [Alkalisalibacterium limincola]